MPSQTARPCVAAPAGRRRRAAAVLTLALTAGTAAPALAGTTERVSVGPGGAQANGVSVEPAISANGRFVAFASGATNLIPIDTNGRRDIFIRDRQTGVTTRVSRPPGGQANGNSFSPAVSAEGRFVAFSSLATNLVPGDTNGAEDIFVRSRETGVITRVNLGPGGVQANPSSKALSPRLSVSAACCTEVGGTVGSGAVLAARVLSPCRTRPMPAAVIISLGRSGA